MNPGKEEYKELVEQFRHHYLTKFGIKLEDDMIYLFIRINEMHLDLKKEVAMGEGRIRVKRYLVIAICVLQIALFICG